MLTGGQERDTENMLTGGQERDTEKTIKGLGIVLMR